MLGKRGVAPATVSGLGRDGVKGDQKLEATRSSLSCVGNPTPKPRSPSAAEEDSEKHSVAWPLDGEWGRG